MWPSDNCLKLMAGMTRDANADPITPGDNPRRSENELIPLVCVSTSRNLRCPDADRDCRQNGNIFFAIRVTILVALPTCSLAGLQPHGLHYAAGL